MVKSVVSPQAKMLVVRGCRLLGVSEGEFVRLALFELWKQIGLIGIQQGSTSGGTGLLITEPVHGG
jgi:hypothetical protein